MDKMEKQEVQKILKITKIILIAVPVVILIAALNKRLAPLGASSDTYSFKRPAALISALSPKGAVEDIEKNTKTGKFYQRILKDPVFFEVKLPFPAKQIDVEMEYQNPQAPIFQLGAQQQKGNGGEFKVEPVENKIIESSDWSRIEDKERGVIFLQKPVEITGEDQPEKTTENKNEELEPIVPNTITPYSSYGEFINDLPLEKNIAVYQYDIFKDYHIKNYLPSSATRLFDKSIRGSHEIVTYLDNENLDFTFFYQERIPQKSPEDFEVKVYRGNQLMGQFEQPEESSSDLKEKSLRVFLENPPTGIYLLKINTGSNVRINKFYTYQQLFAFKDKILLDNPKQNSYFYLKSPYLSFKTSHKEGLQTVSVNDQQLDIKEPQGYYSLLDLEGAQKVFVPKNDLLLEFKGLASLNPEDIPKLTLNAFSLDDYARSDHRQFDFIVSRYYEPAGEINGWKVFKREFKTENLLIKNNKIKFLISVPGASKYRNIKIGRIKVTLRK